MWFDNMIHVTRTIALDNGVMMVGVNGCHLDESLDIYLDASTILDDYQPDGRGDTGETVDGFVYAKLIPVVKNGFLAEMLDELLLSRVQLRCNARQNPTQMTVESAQPHQNIYTIRKCTRYQDIRRNRLDKPGDRSQYQANNCQRDHMAANVPYSWTLQRTSLPSLHTKQAMINRTNYFVDAVGWILYVSYKITLQ